MFSHQLLLLSIAFTLHFLLVDDEEDYRSNHNYQCTNGFSKTRNDGTFRGTFFKNFRNGSKWSKYTYV